MVLNSSSITAHSPILLTHLHVFEVSGDACEPGCNAEQHKVQRKGRPILGRESNLEKHVSTSHVCIVFCRMCALCFVACVHCVLCV